MMRGLDEYRSSNSDVFDEDFVYVIKYTDKENNWRYQLFMDELSKNDFLENLDCKQIKFNDRVRAHEVVEVLFGLF